MVIPHLYYTVCGHSFDVDTFEHFARNPLCRYCKEQKHHFDLEEFGHLSLKKNEKYKERTLANWCQGQRRLYRNGELSKKIEQLRLFDFIFDVQPD